MFDLILENASVLDGSGREPYSSDIGIKGAAIERIGNLEGAEAERRVDVAGRTVCPGFIDVHSHADLAYFRPDHAELLSPLVKQGITTFVGGNCGMGLAPVTREHRDGQKLYLEVFTQMNFEKDVRWNTMGSFMDMIEKEGVLLNTALLAPHGMMRISALGMEMTLADDEAISRMRRSLDESLEAGAFGLSTGLQYFPGNQSDTRELVELGKSLKQHDAIFTSHMRSYTNTTLPLAIDEVAQVARENDIYGHVSHIFSMPWFGPLHRPALKALKWLARHADFSSRVVPDFLIEAEMKSLLGKIERHRNSGVQIGMDVMPPPPGSRISWLFSPPGR